MKANYVMVFALLSISLGATAADRRIGEWFYATEVGGEFKILAECAYLKRVLPITQIIGGPHFDTEWSDEKLEYWSAPVFPAGGSVRVRTETDRGFALGTKYIPRKKIFHSELMPISDFNTENPCLILPNCHWMGLNDGEVMVGAMRGAKLERPFLRTRAESGQVKNRVGTVMPHYLDSTCSNLVTLCCQHPATSNRYSVVVSRFPGGGPVKTFGFTSEWNTLGDFISTDSKGRWAVAITREVDFKTKTIEVRVVTGDATHVISDKSVKLPGFKSPYGGSLEYVNAGYGCLAYYADENRLSILRCEGETYKSAGMFERSKFFPCDMKILIIDMTTGEMASVPVEFPPNN